MRNFQLSTFNFPLNMHFRNLGEIVKALSLQYRQKIRLEVASTKTAAPIGFLADIAFVLEEAPYHASEAAMCENLIYPCIKEAWKKHTDSLAIWTDVTIGVGDKTFQPKYIITKRSEYGKIVLDPPYLAIIVPAFEGLEKAWTTCIQQLYDLQQLNQNPALSVYGIVTNGELWEFAKLEQNVLTYYSQRYDIGDTERLYQGLVNILGLCKKQLVVN